MNLKKAKKLRSVLKYHPADPREYEVLGKGGPVINKGNRRLYQRAKRSAKRARIA